MRSKEGVKMPYEKPKCDCGTFLEFYVEEVSGIVTNVNKNGKRSKRPKIIGFLDVNNEILRCPKCLVDWDYKTDSKGRIVKQERV